MLKTLHPGIISLYQVHVAYRIQKNALNSSRCRRPGDGSFFDTKRTWYRLLKDFSIHKEDAKRFLQCAMEKHAAKLFDVMTSGSCDATADQLRSNMKARLCDEM